MACCWVLCCIAILYAAINPRTATLSNYSKQAMFRDYGDLSLKFALSLPHDTSRSAAKFRSLALDETPIEVIRMKVFVCVCVCVREREREW